MSMNLSKNLPPRLIGGRATTPHHRRAGYNPASSTSGLQSNKGFTVLEMLVVIAVIGILYSVVLPSISNSKAKSRDAKRIADISVIQLALEKYYGLPANKRYPTSLSVFDSSVPTIDPSGNNYSFRALTGDNTATCSGVTCQSYHLGTTLELNNGVLDDDADLNSVALGGFNGADNTTSLFVYDVIPKF